MNFTINLYIYWCPPSNVHYWSLMDIVWCMVELLWIPYQAFQFIKIFIENV